MASLACLYCKNNAVKGPKCVNCGRIFHPKCLERLNDVIIISNDSVKCCEGDVVKFLRSKDFQVFVANIVESKVAVIKEEIQELKAEIKVLRESNIDLIRLFSRRDEFKNNESSTYGGFASKNPSQEAAAMNHLQSVEETQVAAVFSYDKDEKRLPAFNKTATSSISKRNGNLNITDKDPINEEINGTNEEWSKVLGRKKYKNSAGTSVIRGRASSSTVPGLKAAPKKVFIYAGNFEVSTDDRQLDDYLQRKFPQREITIEKLPKRENAKSVAFKITADHDLLNVLNDSEIWPENILIKRFKFFRHKEPVSIANSKPQSVFSSSGL